MKIKDFFCIQLKLHKPAMKTSADPKNFISTETVEEIVLTPVISQTLQFTIPVLYHYWIDCVRGCACSCACTLKQVERAISQNLILNLVSEEKQIKTHKPTGFCIKREFSGHSAMLFCTSYQLGYRKNTEWVQLFLQSATDFTASFGKILQIYSRY